MKRRTPQSPDHKSKLQSPNHEQIRARAYEIYLARGCTPGHELDDWILAEIELKSHEYANLI